MKYRPSYIIIDFTCKNVQKISIHKKDLGNYSHFVLCIGGQYCLKIEDVDINILMKEQPDSEYLDLTSKYVEYLPLEKTICHVAELRCYPHPEHIKEILILRDDMKKYKYRHKYRRQYKYRYNESVSHEIDLGHPDVLVDLTYDEIYDGNRFDIGVKQRVTKQWADGIINQTKRLVYENDAIYFNNILRFMDGFAGMVYSD